MSLVEPPPTDPASRGRLVAAAAVGAAVAAAVLALFAGRGRKPPRLPGDLEHRRASAANRAEPCLQCHARSADVPVPPSHTGRQDCDTCHLLPKR